MRFRCTFSHFFTMYSFSRASQESNVFSFKRDLFTKTDAWSQAQQSTGTFELTGAITAVRLGAEFTAPACHYRCELVTFAGSKLELNSPCISFGIIIFSVWQKWYSQISQLKRRPTPHVDDDRMKGWKNQSYIPQQKIWCCTMLSWSCFVSHHGRWLLPPGQSIGAVTTYHPSLVDPWVIPLRLWRFIRQLTFTLKKILARFIHKNQWWRPKDVPPLQRCCSSYVEALGH